jgi:uncharacterized membrane protein HdeD (DUF308 family)
MALVSSHAHGERADESCGAIDAAFSRGWIWLLLLGGVQLIGGVLAIAIPSTAAIVATIAFGWLLLIAAVAQLAHAFRVPRWRGFALHLAGAVLYGVVGVLLLMRPLPGAAALALVISALLVAEGVMRITMGLRLRPGHGWVWFIAGGIASTVLGALLLVGWPAIALWAIGLLLGIQLIFAGAMSLSLALSCRMQQRRTRSQPASAK